MFCWVAKTEPGWVLYPLSPKNLRVYIKHTYLIPIYMRRLNNVWIYGRGEGSFIWIFATIFCIIYNSVLKHVTTHVELLWYAGITSKRTKDMKLFLRDENSLVLCSIVLISYHCKITFLKSRGKIGVFPKNFKKKILLSI